MLVSMQLATNSRLQVLMEMRECIMYLLVPVLLCFKVTRMKFLKFSSTPKATRLSQHPLIKLVRFGLQKQETKFRP